MFPFPSGAWQLAHFDAKIRAAVGAASTGVIPEGATNIIPATANPIVRTVAIRRISNPLPVGRMRQRAEKLMLPDRESEAQALEKV